MWRPPGDSPRPLAPATLTGAEAAAELQQIADDADAALPVLRALLREELGGFRRELLAGVRSAVAGVQESCEQLLEQQRRRAASHEKSQSPLALARKPSFVASSGAEAMRKPSPGNKSRTGPRIEDLEEPSYALESVAASNPPPKPSKNSIREPPLPGVPLDLDWHSTVAYEQYAEGLEKELCKRPSEVGEEEDPLQEPLVILPLAAKVRWQDTMKATGEKGVVAPPGAGAFGNLTSKAMDSTGMEEEIYNVANFYHRRGACQAIARNQVFVYLTLVVIAVNALYLGFDADFNKAPSLLEAEWYFVLCENLFCVFFTFEIGARFGAFKRKRDCLRDAWFKFDGALVALMIVETWLLPLIFLIGGIGGSGVPTGPLRLLRLLRLSRLARLLRSLPELMTMVKGMRVASRAVASSLLMVCMMIYAFAIAMHMFLSEDATLADKWGRLPSCMWTLLMDGTFMDSIGETLSRTIESRTPSAYIAITVFMIFVLLSAMTVMNMLIGVLCEVVGAVGRAEKEDLAIRMMKETILLELRKFDEDGNAMISRNELSGLMQDWGAKGVLESLQVEVKYFGQIQDMLFPDEDSEVTMETIMLLMLMCRGDLETTVHHLVNTSAYTHHFISKAFLRHEERMKLYMRDLIELSQASATWC